MSTFGWMIDSVLVVLLSATCFMAIRLDRALRIVRRDRAAFEALISSLSTATNAVKLGIQKLRDEAERSAGQIERRSAEADRMATDLSFLIERAESAGGRLEATLRGAADATEGVAGRAEPSIGKAKRKYVAEGPLAAGPATSGLAPAAEDEEAPETERRAQKPRRRRVQNPKLKLVG